MRRPAPGGERSRPAQFVTELGGDPDPSQVDCLTPAPGRGQSGGSPTDPAGRFPVLLPGCPSPVALRQQPTA